MNTGPGFLRCGACSLAAVLILGAGCAKSPASSISPSAATFPAGVPAPVTPPPTIQVTRFMAFGDSLTEGEWWPGISQLQTYDPTKSYPTFLLQLLQARYSTQTFVMKNEGVGGSRAECDDDGGGVCPNGVTRRFSPALATNIPEVVLLLEGINDLFDNQNSLGVDKLAHALRNDIRNAKARGAWVFLSTLPAERPATTDVCAPACRDQSYFDDNPALLAAANAAIRSVALTEGATLVDGYAITAANPNKFVGADGLHLSIEGYQALAAGFFEAIKAKYEVATPVQPAWTKGPSIPSVGAHVEVGPQRPR